MKVSKEYFRWYIATDYSHIIPELPGCYAFYILNYYTKRKRLIYIGTANNLYKRLKKHEIKKVLNALLEYPEIIFIKCKVILNEKIRLRTENWLINRLKPKTNYI